MEFGENGFGFLAELTGTTIRTKRCSCACEWVCECVCVCVCCRIRDANEAERQMADYVASH